MSLKEYFLSSNERPSLHRSKLSACMPEILELSKVGYSSRQIAKGLEAIGITISHQAVSAQIKKHTLILSATTPQLSNSSNGSAVDSSLSKTMPTNVGQGSNEMLTESDLEGFLTKRSSHKLT
jgi:hypothetical protein